MKLSTAMMLGSTTCKMKPGKISSCAIGAALNALGEPVKGRYGRAEELWPWLSTEYFGVITAKFDTEVCYGHMTLEQLVDYVRSVEPSCGECNRFNCSCVKSEALPVTESVTA